MLYTEYINKAINLTVTEADNGLFYLEPLWRNILYDNNMNIRIISDTKTDWNRIYDVLKLEVEKRNTINSKTPAVVDWLYNIIIAQIEPAILEEETDYIKQMTEFMRANHELEMKDKNKKENQELMEQSSLFSKIRNT